MTAPKDLPQSRRDFLKTTGAGLAVAATLPLAHSIEVRAADGPIASLSSDLFFTKETVPAAKTLATEFLTQTKSTAQDQQLTLRSALSLEWPSDADALMTRLRTLIESDFSDDHTVMLDGWVVSITEARLYTLSLS